MAYLFGEKQRGERERMWERERNEKGEKRKKDYLRESWELQMNCFIVLVYFLLCNIGTTNKIKLYSFKLPPEYKGKIFL